MRLVFMLWVLVGGVFLLLMFGAQAQAAEISRKTDDIHIAVRYPSLGQTVIDADMVHWVTELVQDFEQNFGQPGMRVPEAPPFSLHISYNVARSSDRAVSVIFEVDSYTGGVHGNTDILVRTYDMQSGRLLTPEHIFEDVESALQMMSTYCATALRIALGEAVVEDMLKAGTSPDMDNFLALALGPHGVRVYFQPYQVAPWSAGPQTVDIPLDALGEARPLMEWWGAK